MAVEHGKIEVPIHLTDYLVLSGIATQQITVLDGGDLQLSGMACKGVTVHEGGRAVINGTVSGDVVNQGGYLEVHGVVHGRVVKVAGETRIADGAVVKR